MKYDLANISIGYMQRSSTKAILTIIKSFYTRVIHADVVWIIYIVIIAALCSVILLFGREESSHFYGAPMWPLATRLRNVCSQTALTISTMTLISWQQNLCAEGADCSLNHFITLQQMFPRCILFTPKRPKIACFFSKSLPPFGGWG